jgi:hypothetical protein
MQKISPSSTGASLIASEPWYFKCGAGWPNIKDSMPASPYYNCPWLFLSLSQLITYYATLPIYTPRFGPMLYSLKGVPSSTAVCVGLPPASVSVCFYMAPNYASQWNFYLSSKFKYNAAPGTGPAASPIQATSLRAAYVLIANGAATYPSFVGLGNLALLGTPLP